MEGQKDVEAAYREACKRRGQERKREKRGKVVRKLMKRNARTDKDG